jgi:hypothetical protein
VVFVHCRCGTSNACCGLVASCHPVLLALTWPWCTAHALTAGMLLLCRARGIDQTAARQALVYSFGAEVVQQLGYKSLQERLQRDVAAALSGVDVASS